MTPRRRAILVVSLFAIALLGLILFILWLLGQRTPAAPPTTDVPAAAEEPVAAAPTPAVLGNPLEPARSPEPEQRVAAVQLAELFAERYGSYSSHDSYENLRDLLPVMSASFRAKTEALLAENSAAGPAGAYEGVTSVRVSTTTRTYDEATGRARMGVSLQQTASKGTVETVSYRTLEVWLVKEGPDWKVNAVEWAQ